MCQLRIWSIVSKVLLSCLKRGSKPHYLTAVRAYIQSFPAASSDCRRVATACHLGQKSRRTRRSATSTIRRGSSPILERNRESSRSRQARNMARSTRRLARIHSVPTASGMANENALETEDQRNSVLIMALVVLARSRTGDTWLPPSCIRLYALCLTASPTRLYPRTALPPLLPAAHRRSVPSRCSLRRSSIREVA